MNNIYPVFVALTFNGLDLLTGLVSAIKNKNIVSSKLRDGLFKKVGFMLCYIVSWLIDTYGVIIGIDFGVKLLPIIIGYVCMTELVSILENICKINPDLSTAKIMQLFHISENKGE